MKCIKSVAISYNIHKEKEGADYFYLCDYDFFENSVRFDIGHFNEMFRHKTACKDFDYYNEIRFLIVQRVDNELSEIGSLTVAEAYKSGHQSRLSCDIINNLNNHMSWMNYHINLTEYADIRGMSDEQFPTYSTLEASYDNECTEGSFDLVIKRTSNNSNVLTLYDTDDKNEMIECLYAALDHKAVKEANKNKQRERTPCLAL